VARARGAVTGSGVDHWDDATAEASPDERAARVRAFADRRGRLDGRVLLDPVGVAAFANSDGQRLTGRGTSATIDGILDRDGRRQP
jgi:hypothetical protein